MATDKRPSFIDLFAGCGGLSLGLIEAGWRGLFAVEQATDAFRTLKHNLIDQRQNGRYLLSYSWPTWLEERTYDIREFVKSYRKQLGELRGKVQLVAGGPPCQGFSFAGKRERDDPRNELFKHYIEVVDLIKPEFVLLENVQGLSVVHGVSKRGSIKRRGRPKKSYAERIREVLETHDFDVQQRVVIAKDFGVPQIRPRYITFGIRRDLLGKGSPPDLFETLKGMRKDFLRNHRLPVNRPVSVYEAISDLETVVGQLVHCIDRESPPGFMEIRYRGPKSRYQRLMHKNMGSNLLNSLRLVNHKAETVLRFQKIFSSCRKGVQLSRADRERLRIGKRSITPLAPDKPAHTLTTLPDDLLHYSEPRIPTVREQARLQGFPDWFEFKGKFTTGGDRRAMECPRYTQVGNAVPPLLAEVTGNAILTILRELRPGYLPGRFKRGRG
jgi:DNA (cytosine-5)-methyltransferase 1